MSLWRRISDLLGPSPYTGEQPEAEARNRVLSDPPGPRPDYTSPRFPQQDPEEFYFVATPLWVRVGKEPHQELMDGLAWRRDLPNAYGKLNLLYRWDALWEVEHSNMSMEKLENALKTYSKDQGWNFESMVDRMGDKIATVHVAEYPGIGEINPGVKDWRNREWSGMEQFDNADVTHPSDYPGYTDQDQQEPIGTGDLGVYTCSDCGYPAADYNDWRGHIMREHVQRGTPAEHAEPVVDLDDALPAHWDKVMLDQTDQRKAHLRLAFARTGVGVQPQIPGPIPMIYDIEQDRIYVGHPGERHSDIQGRFTPGGIVEGTYTPKGELQLRTDTDMPYTVKHFVQLWYAMHPELEIKQVQLLVGQEQYRLAKLSSMDIGHKVRSMVATDPAAWDAYQALKHFGNVYVVGGAVRDVILGKTPNDYDLLVQGVPAADVEDILKNLPGRVDVTGKQFGVLRYRNPDGDEVEVALPRKEFSTGEGHRDFDVQSDHHMSVEEDLGRRDFTANAMAVNLATGELIDPYDGSLDIKGGVLNSVSDTSLEEDPLRILRVLTAISKHKLIPSRALLTQIRDNAYRVQNLPAERLQMELDKMIKGDDPAYAIKLLEETDLFKYVLPEYDRTRGFDQRNPHHYELLHDHLKSVLGRTVEQTNDPDVRWAALLHDIGKPRSLWIDPERGTGHYYQNREGLGKNHWSEGATMSRDLLSRLKFPTNRIDRISHLIEHHMFPKFSSERGARKFINRVGAENTDDLLTLRAADIAGRERTDDVGVMRNLVHRVRQSGQATDRSGLAINGQDLIAAGMQPGPELGETIKFLTNQVLEDPSLNEPSILLELAQQAYTGQRTANILDPIHDVLDPTVWDEPESSMPRLKPKLARFVKRKIYQTLKDAGWPDPEDTNYLSLVLTGSLCTYQYSTNSDFDISLWIDTQKLPDWVRADLIRMMIEKVDGTIVPGTTHPMQDFVVDVTKYTKNDLYKVGLRSGYDIDTGVWIVPPDKTRSVDVDKQYHSSLVYAHGVVDKLKTQLRFGNDEAVKIYWKFLHNERHKDMAAGKGDFAESNIVYKLIANEGLFPAISEATGMYLARKVGADGYLTWQLFDIIENSKWYKMNAYWAARARGPEALKEYITEEALSDPNLSSISVQLTSNEIDWKQLYDWVLTLYDEPDGDIPQMYDLMQKANEHLEAAPNSIRVVEGGSIPEDHPDRRDFGFTHAVSLEYQHQKRHSDDPESPWYDPSSKPEYWQQLFAEGGDQYPEPEGWQSGGWQQAMQEDQQRKQDLWSRWEGKPARADYFYHPEQGWSLGAN